VALRAPGAALDAFERARAVLGEQLGVDPGPRLRGLHRAILADDTDAMWGLLDDAGPDGARPAARASGPAQLPMDVPGFTGREAELARLDALIAPGPAGATAVVVAAVSGLAGVGKTALACTGRTGGPRASRRPAVRQPARLRPRRGGHEPGRGRARFLDALGVPAARVPADLDGQAALYRSLMAGRRMLVMLDNARDSEQVRALLPARPAGWSSSPAATGWPASSRSRARGRCCSTCWTATRPGASSPPPGEDRVAAEPAAVDEIVAGCAGLPLALAIVAARAAVNPRVALAAFAAQLREAGGGLDALAEPDCRATCGPCSRGRTAG